MFESLITISVAGFLAGFLFSMPVAGPVSILIVSHALKGERHFALAAASGAAVVDALYCFIAVYGFTNLYYLYSPFIPYALIIGSLFLFILGYKIRHTHLDLEHIDEKNDSLKKHPRLRKRGRFLNGFMINLLNPTLFFGWLTSSFVMLSFIASLGLNVGGLEGMIESNVETISHDNNMQITQIDTSTFNHSSTPKKIVKKPSTSFQVLNSVAFALFIALGSVFWFFHFSRFLVEHRKRIRMDIIDKIIHTLGFALWGFGIYLLYKGITILLA